MEPAMPTPAEQGQQEVRQDRQDAPDRHPWLASQPETLAQRKTCGATDSTQVVVMLISSRGTAALIA